MQIIEYSECLKDVINLSIIAKEYYECMCQNHDKCFYEISIKYVSFKQYDTYMSEGVKERCINLIKEAWGNVNNSDTFYQYLLTNVCCNDIMIERLSTILNDMLMFVKID